VPPQVHQALSPVSPAHCRGGFLRRLLRRLDSWEAVERRRGRPPGKAWWGHLPFLVLHLACLAVLWVGFSWTALAVAAGLYFLRMFAVTAFYHRYFAHRAFRAGRKAQFVFAVLGASAVQRGPLWWAAHHRHHHRASDREDDVHSPRHHGFWGSHVGWILKPENARTRLELIPDFARFPELRFLDRYDTLVPALLALALFGLGELLASLAPGLGTDGWQLLVWGFVVSTVVLYHGTFVINSLCHVWGRQRYATGDDSRNNFWLALITLGEGWHNNHHRYPNSARQGFFWWELDVSYALLRVLERLGVVRDLRPVPERILRAAAGTA